MSVEAAHTCAQESMQLHSSLSTLPSKTLGEKNYFISVKSKGEIPNVKTCSRLQAIKHDTIQ